MPYFDRDAFKDSFQAQCKGKQTCSPVFSQAELLSLPADMRYENMVLFAQVGCKMTEDGLVAKRLWGLAIGCLGTCIVLFLRIKIGFIKTLDEINEKLYDQNLITIEDYTVLFTVTSTMFEKFKKEHEDFTKFEEDYNMMLDFEKDIQNEIEKQVC